MLDIEKYIFLSLFLCLCSCPSFVVNFLFSFFAFEFGLCLVVGESLIMLVNYANFVIELLQQAGICFYWCVLGFKLTPNLNSRLLKNAKNFKVNNFDSDHIFNGSQFLELISNRFPATIIKKRFLKINQ